jgi:hypothetical protein
MVFELASEFSTIDSRLPPLVQTPPAFFQPSAVLDDLGKKAGPEDDRTEEKRFHDALQLACEPQLASCRCRAPVGAYR